MPEHRPSPRLRLKFAALGAVGGAMVLLPLGQVLRYQGAELQLLMSERAALDPLSHALAVQRNVISHRDVAQRVLLGRAQLEPERRLRQGAVDQSLWALHGALSAGRWIGALGEIGAMMMDWRELTRRIALREIDVADSQTQHQLLVEQAVQVMDWVSAGAPAGSFGQLAGLQGRRFAPIGRATSAQASTAPQPLAALEHALVVRSAALDERAANLQSQRAALLCAGAAWFTFVLGVWAWRVRPAPSGEGTDGVRRNRGRRQSDASAQPSESTRLVERLRAGSAEAAVEPDRNLPPTA